MPLITAVAGIGVSPVYLELEGKKLVKGLESRGWCGTELTDSLTPLALGTYSLHLIKVLSCHVLASLSVLVVLWGQWVPWWAANSSSIILQIGDPSAEERFPD